MGDNESVPLNAIINISNSIYKSEISALFKNAEVTTYSLEKENLKEIIAKLESSSVRNAIYISDSIDEEIINELLNLAITFENILLIDENTKPKIMDNEGISLFNHVLSCNQQQTPQLQITSTIRKIKEQKFLGVDKCVAYGAYVHKYVLSNSDQRQWFRDALFEFVIGLSSVLGRPTDGFAQFSVEVQEELLMNAIWDANPELRKLDRRVPVALLPHETVQVEWSFDGVNLAIGVRDPFGSFGKLTVIKYLKFLFASNKKNLVQIQEEGRGAGLGLFMVLERLSSLVITLIPNKTTEVIAILDLTATPKAFSKKQRSFQFFRGI